MFDYTLAHHRKAFLTWFIHRIMVAAALIGLGWMVLPYFRLTRLWPKTAPLLLTRVRKTPQTS